MGCGLHHNERRSPPHGLKIPAKADSSTSNTPRRTGQTWRAGSISLRLTAVCKDNGVHARDLLSDGMFVPRQSVGRSPMEFGCTGEQPHLSAADAFKPLRCKTDAGIAVVPSIRIIRA
jgi:hypothetical protein